MKILKLTKKEFEAIRYAVGNFTCGDYHDCQSDKKLYTTMLRVEKKIMLASKSDACGIG